MTAGFLTRPANPPSPKTALAFKALLESARLVVCPGLLLLSLTGLAFGQTQGTVAGLLIKPENIVFVGNRVISSEDLRTLFSKVGTVHAALPPDQLHLYNNDRINDGLRMLRALYRNRGFIKVKLFPPDFDLGPQEGSNQLRLIIRIEEDGLYQLSQIQITGSRLLGNDHLLSLLNVQGGTPVNLSKIDIGALAIKEAFLRLGYLDVVIKPALEPENKNRAKLTLDIQAGKQYRVGKIDFQGTCPLNLDLLRSYLPLRSGDVFGKQAFESCLESINDMGITPTLKETDITFNFSKPATVDLVIHLQGK